jgi:hypothetical protein
MAYSSGGLIEATDYNGFVNVGANNVNRVWSTGSTDAGWGETALSTVSVGGTVTATNWASLVNTLTTMGNQTNTTITSRTAPVTGNTISILANVATDINNITTNRGNAALSGTISTAFTGTTSKTAATAANAAGWTITFTHTVTFASADAARYFFNAGGLIRIDMSKTSTGSDKDPDWNSFVGTVGSLFLSGRVNSAAQTIAGTSYTGFTRSGGSGTPSPNLTTTGWYSFTGGAAATTMWQLNSVTSPYTADFIRVTAAVNAGRTILTLITTWVDGGYAGAGKDNSISGGTATTSPFSTFGTAPTVLVRFVPPSSTYLTTAAWGTPAVAASVA